MYWSAQKTLVISDLHLGKAKHFVKAGIALPARSLEQKNIDRLNILTKYYRPEKIIFLGDLFHSSYNQAWEQFCQYTSSFPKVEFILVEGNHDFLDQNKYQQAKLKVETELCLGPFVFTHEPLLKDHQLYNLSGHIHPGVRMSGPAGQGGRFPCFYFGKKTGIMPAFGTFTGLHIIRTYKNDQVFIVAEHEVLSIRIN